METRFYDLLLEAAEEASARLSNPDRDSNPTGERFSIHKTFILSSRAATIIYLKTPSRKKCAVFFYWHPAWKRFVFFPPSDAIVLAMAEFVKLKVLLEQENYENWLSLRGAIEDPVSLGGLEEPVGTPSSGEAPE